jgi:hypothetical protein
MKFVATCAYRKQVSFHCTEPEYVTHLTIRLLPLRLKLFGDIVDLPHGKLTSPAKLRSDLLFCLTLMPKSQNRRFLLVCCFFLGERSEELVAFRLKCLACDLNASECADDFRSANIFQVSEKEMATHLCWSFCP